MNAYATEPNEQADAGVLAHIPAILKQRYRWIAVPTIVGLLGGTAAAFLLPTLYRSSATVLVESQQVPGVVVGATGDTNKLVEERLARIRQQILSRENLVELIKANSLYPREAGSKPLSVLVDRMRDATSIQPDNADFRRNNQTLISFKVSFEYPEKEGAQIVAQEYVERLVQLDSEQRGTEARNAAEFLKAQAAELGGQLTQIERRVAQIKAENGMVLSTTNMPFVSSGGGLEMQISMLERENSQLQSQLKAVDTAANRDPMVVSLEQTLTSLRSRYSDNHPDVKATEQQLAEARTLAKKTVAENPSTAMLRQQISSNAMMIGQLRAQSASERTQTAALSDVRTRAPLVMEQISQLEARADEIRARYQTVASNLMNAEASLKIADEQKGERLTIIDAPVTPDRPASPNRPMWILGGALAGFVLGLACLVLLELIYQPVRGAEAIRAILGRPPLGVIPILSAKTRIRRKFRIRLFRRGAKAKAA